MSRKLPRSFFWVDQQLIRSGTWLKLCPQSRLAYIAISASVDREGISIWSRSKLMELSGCLTPEDLQQSLIELETHRLIESLAEQIPPAIRLCSLDPGEEEVSTRATGIGRTQHQRTPSSPLIIHTTVHVGGELRNVEPRESV